MMRTQPKISQQSQIKLFILWWFIVLKVLRGLLGGFCFEICRGDIWTSIPHTWLGPTPLTCVPPLTRGPSIPTPLKSHTLLILILTCGLSLHWTLGPFKLKALESSLQTAANYSEPCLVARQRAGQSARCWVCVQWRVEELDPLLRSLKGTRDPPQLQVRTRACPRVVCLFKCLWVRVWAAVCCQGHVVVRWPWVTLVWPILLHLPGLVLKFDLNTVIGTPPPPPPHVTNSDYTRATVTGCYQVIIIHKIYIF